MNQQFIDTAIIKVSAGKGGDGKVSFRREKYIPKGGPDGGDGGKGGNVYFIGDNNMSTLMDFRSKPGYKAENGLDGGKKRMTGPAGDDLYIKVPLGTQLYDTSHSSKPEDGVLIADIVSPNIPVLVARGGTGGKGNDRFKSSVNRKPMQFTRGRPGETKNIRLEVKLIADVGLVGLPNAGKSTLLNQLTSANAKIGSYPFTTLSPNLGVCALDNGVNIIIADIPGLIEGAASGKGLGDEFLKHIERTRLLVHLIDPFDFENSSKGLIEHSLHSFSVIRRELEDFSQELVNKKSLVVINKMDITEVKENMTKLTRAFQEQGIKVHFISAVTGEGVSELKNQLRHMLPTVSLNAIAVSEPAKVYNIVDLPNKRMVFLDESDSEVEEKVASKKDK